MDLTLGVGSDVRQGRTRSSRCAGQQEIKSYPVPSNLQGLYRCDYEGGDRLSYKSKMKLLKTFRQFRS
jgi:hypothetical protein